MRLFSDSIGRKVIMAVTGLLMVLFVIGHMLGNLTIFAGPNGINSYAFHLHELAPVVWGTRIVMGAAVLLHLFISIQITLENSAAKPDRYAVQNHLRATWMSRNMIWTGAIIGAFIVYHLLHFTFRITPNLALGFDYLNRFDVYTMVVRALGSVVTGLVYIVAMVALGFHLWHGVYSMFGSLGLDSARYMNGIRRIAAFAATVIALANISVPVAVLTGLLHG